MAGYDKLLLIVINLMISAVIATITSIAVEKMLKTVLFKSSEESAKKIKSHVFLFLLFLGVFLSFYELIQSYFPSFNIIIDAIFIAYLINKLIDIFLTWYLSKLWAKAGIEIKEELLPLFVRILKLAVYGIVFIIAIQKAGYDVGALIAGLGIGGLALALASQQTLSNLFAAVSLLADKSLKVGQRVKLEDAVGTIMEIGWRSTKIKTKDGILIVPNSVLSNSKIMKLPQK